MNMLIEKYQQNLLKLQNKEDQENNLLFKNLKNYLQTTYAEIIKYFKISYVQINKNNKIGLNGYVEIDSIDIPIFIYMQKDDKNIYCESELKFFSFPLVIGNNQDEKINNLEIIFGRKLLEMKQTLNEIIEYVNNDSKPACDRLAAIEKYNLYSKESFKQKYDELYEHVEKIKLENKVKAQILAEKEFKRKTLVELGQEELDKNNKEIQEIIKQIKLKYTDLNGFIYKIKYIPNIFNLNDINEEEFDLDLICNTIVKLDENIILGDFHKTIKNNKFIETKITNCTIIETEKIPMEERFFVNINIGNSIIVRINPIYYKEATEYIQTLNIPEPFNWEKFWEKYKTDEE